MLTAVGKPFPSALEISCSDEIALKMLQYLAYLIIKVCRSSAHYTVLGKTVSVTETICTGLWKTSRAADKYFAQLCGKY